MSYQLNITERCHEEVMLQASQCKDFALESYTGPENITIDRRLTPSAQKTPLTRAAVQPEDAQEPTLEEAEALPVDVKSVDTVDYSFNKWTNYIDKHKDEYYENSQFRAAYTAAKLLPRAQWCCNMISPRVEELLCRFPSYQHSWRRFLASPTSPRPLRVLSLGCGPGTDLLAVVWAFRDLSGVSPLTLECVGVDKQPWDYDELHREFNNVLETSSSNFAVYWKIYQADCAEFVSRCVITGETFDLVICCYAGAREKLQLLREAVPGIISDRGSIFVIDNDCAKLRNGLTFDRLYYVSSWPTGKRPIFLVKDSSNF